MLSHDQVQSALPYPYVDQTITPLKDLGALELLNGEHVLTAEITAVPAGPHAGAHGTADHLRPGSEPLSWAMPWATHCR